MAGKQRQKSTNSNEEKLERNADAASVTIFRVVRVFKELSRNYSIIFLFHRKFQHHVRMYRKYGVQSQRYGE